MAKSFRDLRNRMSPGATKAAESKAKALLAALPAAPPEPAGKESAEGTDG